MTLASASLLVSSCGGSGHGSGCTLTGHTTFTEYNKACVMDLDRNRLDSVELTDGSFTFHVADSVDTPYPLYLTLGMQQFLDGLQACKDAVMMKKGLTAQDIRDIFSDYYKTQIQLNKDYALGRYIYRVYGSRLTDADRGQVEALMSPEPKKQ